MQQAQGDPRLDGKLAACLAEYNRLWEEVRKKWESQQQLTNQLVYLTAGGRPSVNFRYEID